MLLEIVMIDEMEVGWQQLLMMMRTEAGQQTASFVSALPLAAAAAAAATDQPTIGLLLISPTSSPLLFLFLS